MDELEMVLRAAALYVAVQTPTDTGKPQEVIDRAELYYNWITQVPCSTTTLK